jgi:hypothetical protein
MLTSLQSCARAPIETVDDTVSNVTISGAFSDWNPSASNFSGGVFLLLDAVTNEIFKSDPIKADSPSFQIRNVPVTGKYYGILLGADFQPLAYLQKKAPDGKTILPVFKVGNTDGQFGTLVIKNGKLESSQQSEIDFQTSVGAHSELRTFAADFSTNFIASPDIDTDGIPNVLDTDVDGDGDNKPNALDSATYAGKTVKTPDSEIPWQFNYGYGIPKMGFFKCEYLRTPNAKDNATFLFKYSCQLKMPAKRIEKITLRTTQGFMDGAKFWNGADPFDWNMRDDGSLGDLISEDGIWTGRFSVTDAIPSYANQTILADVKMKDGTMKSYITTLEPKIEFKTRTDQPLAAFVSAEDNLYLFFSLGQLSGTLSGFQISATILKDADDTEIATLTQPLFDAGASAFAGISQLGLAATTDDMKYRIKVKITAPAALPGLLGNAFELYSLPLDYTP